MKIVRAKHLGMCFGVRDAISLAVSEGRKAPLTVLGQLVHNEEVLKMLSAEGVGVAGQARDVRTERAMITAHGASEKFKQAAERTGLTLLEGTCPLVKVAHRAVTQLVKEGYYPVIIGQPGHVEVRGLSEDLHECSIVLNDADLDSLPVRTRYGIASQTTQPIARVLELVENLRGRHPDAEIKFIDTVCQPTKQRQLAAVELAKSVDLVLVIGGSNSNNTRELVQTCSRFCSRVLHVQTVADLRSEWFLGVSTIGLTAGTSTPDGAVDEIESWLRERAVNQLAA